MGSYFSLNKYDKIKKRKIIQLIFSFLPQPPKWRTMQRMMLMFRSMTTSAAGPVYILPGYTGYTGYIPHGKGEAGIYCLVNVKIIP